MYEDGRKRQMFIETYGPKETYELGRKIGEGAKAGTVFALTGDLGAGKTVFLKRLAAGLCITGHGRSPTLTNLQIY